MILLNIPSALATLNGVVLPTPSRGGFKDTPNKIWSQNTGRTAGQNGKMVGDIIAIKRSIDITWERLDEQEVRLIRSIVENPKNNFVPFQYYDPAEDRLIDITIYTGDTTFTLDVIDSNHAYYSGVTLSLVEQ